MSHIDRIESRIRQIENRIERGPNINSTAFNKLMAGQSASKPKEATFGSQDAASNKLHGMGYLNRMQMQGFQGAGVSASVKPLAQSNSVSCGQTSVAMCVNALTGRSMNDMDVDNNYGFQLLEALKTETQPHGYDWKDAGNISSSSWSMIDRKVNQEGLPVMIALNGPEFSASGRGHIVTIVKTEGNKVTYADPADGTMKTTTKYAMETAPSHPDGNFVFVADKVAPEAPPSNQGIAHTDLDSRNL